MGRKIEYPYRIEKIPEGVAVYGWIPLREMSLVMEACRAEGLDTGDILLAQKYGALLVVVARSPGTADD